MPRWGKKLIAILFCLIANVAIYLVGIALMGFTFGGVLEGEFSGTGMQRIATGLMISSGYITYRYVYMWVMQPLGDGAKHRGGNSK
jgi:hypothetical protein